MNHRMLNFEKDTSLIQLDGHHFAVDFPASVGAPFLLCFFVTKTLPASLSKINACAG